MASLSCSPPVTLSSVHSESVSRRSSTDLAKALAARRRPVIPDSVSFEIKQIFETHDSYRRADKASSQTFMEAGLFSESPSRTVPQPCLSSEPSQLPPNWSAHVYPGGGIYFRGDFLLPVVTEANIYDPKVLHSIDRWRTEISAFIVDSNLGKSHQLELFVDMSGLDYHIVDHSNRSLFQVEPSNPGIAGVESSEQFGLKSKELYWQHVKHFPSHRPVQDSDEQMLKSLLGRGFADEALGSTNSSLPFNGSQCQEFLKILSNDRADSDGPHRVCLIAGLLSSIYKHRFLTSHGEEYPRPEWNASPPQNDLSVPRRLRSALLTIFNAITNILVAMNLPPGLPYTFPGEDKITNQTWKEYLTLVMNALKIETSCHEPLIALIVAHFLSDLTNPVSLFLLRASLGWILLSIIHSRILLACCGQLILSYESGRLWRKHGRQLGNRLLKPNPLYIFMLPSLCSTIAIIHVLLAWLFTFLCPGNENQIKSQTPQILLIVNFSIGIASLFAVVVIWWQYLRVHPDSVA